MSRHTSEWWSKRVAELAKCGDAEEIAGRYGVRARTLVWWRSELARRARGTSSAGPRLLPVVIEPRRERVADVYKGVIEVAIESGASRVHVRGAVTADHLAAIVGAIARAC